MVSIIVLAGLVAISLCIGVAILRYALFDIDRVISPDPGVGGCHRPAGGGVRGDRAAGHRGRSITTPVAVAAATLAAGGTVQSGAPAGAAGVDRRFNRARYDADQTIAAFAAHLQDAVDLEGVSR